jgi:hypothetical protein
MKERKIAKVVTRRSLREKTNGYAFWQRMSPESRIEALEEIRQEYTVVKRK